MAKNQSNPLGKGLGALLPSFDLDDDDHFGRDTESPYTICPIDKIRPNRDQPRKNIDADKLHELAFSIKEKGILQPLVVARDDSGGFELIAGERRWRAAHLAGLAEVPVIIKNLSHEEDRLELALIENIQRQNLNPIEEAFSYQRLHQEFNLTQDEIAKKVGKERSTITNCLRLLQLPEDIQAHLANERLSAGHARALLSLLDNVGAMHQLCEDIVTRQMSVREAEEVAKKLKNKAAGKTLKPEGKSKTKGALSSSYCKALCKNIETVLGTKSKIVQKGARGKLELEYHSPDDLDRLLSLLLRGRETKTLQNSD